MLQLVIIIIYLQEWVDYRLKWNEEKLRRPKIKIESMGSIWVPDMSSEE